MFQTDAESAMKLKRLVLIPSEQGNVSNSMSVLVLTRVKCLNPFGTGKCFKRITATNAATMYVLIPSEQGNVSNQVKQLSVNLINCLNPFGTGKCFKRRSIDAINEKIRS